MDLQMPGLNGIEATRQILHTSLHISILVLTMFEDDNSVFAALRAGIRGYLLKGALKPEILNAIRSVSSGEAIFGPTIAKWLMQYLAAPPPAAPPQVFPELTEREREILNLLAQHLTNPEIAERLALMQKTVRNHVSNIFTKLQGVGPYAPIRACGYQAFPVRAERDAENIFSGSQTTLALDRSKCFRG